MSTSSTLSLHTLSVVGKDVLTETGAPFDAVSYSKFKYGDGGIALQYGYALAQKFIAVHSELFASPEEHIPLVVTTSPYKYVPKGASGIVKGFVIYLNQYLYHRGKLPISEIKIFKDNMFEGDYGTFSVEERERLTQANELYIIEKYIEGKHIVVIDDVRITGAHERNIEEFLDNKKVGNIFFLYVGQMEQVAGKQNPQIESALNHAWVDSFAKLAPIVSAEGFLLNARVCKYIFSSTDEQERKDFFAAVPTAFLLDLYNGAIGDGYASMSRYARSCDILIGELNARNVLVGKLIPHHQGL